ncbi:MAG: recombinase family protein [Oenococcus oeni]
MKDVISLVFYACVSFTDQNLARQLARAKEVKADKVFTNKLSGKDTKRPAFKACLNYLREDNTLEVFSLDRLSRNYQNIKQIVSQLKNKKIRLIIDDLPNMNTGNPLIDANMQGQTHSSIFEFLLAMAIYIIVFVLGSVIFLNKKTFNKELPSIEYVVRATIKEESFVSS